MQLQELKAVNFPGLEFHKDIYSSHSFDLRPYNPKAEVSSVSGHIGSHMLQLLEARGYAAVPLARSLGASRSVAVCGVGWVETEVRALSCP